AVTRDLNRARPSRHEDLLQLFGEGCHRDLVRQAQLLEDAHADSELPLSSVEQQKLWRVGKARPAPSAPVDNGLSAVGNPLVVITPVARGRSVSLGTDGR